MSYDQLKEWLRQQADEDMHAEPVIEIRKVLEFLELH